jgi:hypothetical protein
MRLSAGASAELEVRVLLQVVDAHHAPARRLVRRRPARDALNERDRHARDPEARASNVPLAERRIAPSTATGQGMLGLAARTSDPGRSSLDPLGVSSRTQRRAMKARVASDVARLFHPHGEQTVSPCGRYGSKEMETPSWP